MNAQSKIIGTDAVAVFAGAFLKMQAEIKPAIKDTANGAFKGTKYADLGAVWEAIKAPLHDNGFSVIQSPDFDGEIMWLRTTVLHVSGERIEGRYPLRPSKQDPQGYGSALTYARRYSLSAMLGVIADDDDDGNAASARPQNGTAVHPTSAPPHGDDADIAAGARNWVDLQKETISEASTLPELTAWLDEQGGSWTTPKAGGKLAKLARHQGAMFKELKEYYLNRMNKV